MIFITISLMNTLRIAIPTKLQIHANTILCLLNSLNIPGYNVEIRFLIGKSNIDQSRSILSTNFYDEMGDNDLFMFIDSDQTFNAGDIIELINLNTDVAVGVYNTNSGFPACRPKNLNEFLTGTNNDVYYGATGFMLIRKGILKKIEQFIKKENMGYSRFWISHDYKNIIPFFNQRLIISETIPSDKPMPEWLGEDYGFCWLVRQVGGTIKCHISPTIGHEIPKLLYFYPEQYRSKKWDNNTIVYYTGNSRLKWSPNSLAKGISGSESAVIYLTKYWQQSGYKVTVYGNVDEGIYDGVNYLSTRKFSINDQFSTLILWRGYGLSILNKVKTRKLFIDLHDEPSAPYQVLIEAFDKIDAIFVKSNYHKSLFPENMHNKFIVLQNGVSDQYFIGTNSQPIKKDRYKLIYCSSYDRGLYPMLKYGWKIIKTAIPNAELHLYYGMNLLAPELKNELLPLLNQEGIIDHGMVSHDEIFRAKLESSIHYYIGGIYEVDCISIKESVMAKCLPVVSNNNVFIERDYCLKVNGGPFDQQTHIDGAKLIIKLLTDNEFYKESLKIVENNSICDWKTIAANWLDIIKHN